MKSVYCKKCGIRIKEGQEKCPECGTEQDKPEYCGGFWGLIGNQREDEASRQIQKQPEEGTSRQLQQHLEEEISSRLQQQKELLKEKQRLKQQCETLKNSCQRQKSHTAVLTGIVVLLATVCMILTILLLQDARRPDEAVTVKMETEQQDGYAPSEKQTKAGQQDSYAPSEKQTFPQKQNNQKNQKQNSPSRNEQNRKDRKNQEQKIQDKKNDQRNQAETV